jgi:hypothetical protein
MIQNIQYKTQVLHHTYTRMQCILQGLLCYEHISLTRSTTFNWVTPTSLYMFAYL